MKRLLLFALLAVPSVAAAADPSPLGLALRIGPTWRDHSTFRCAEIKEGGCSLLERTENRAELSATIAPSLRLTPNVSIVGELRHYFETDDEEVSAQLEIRWPGCSPAAPPWRSELAEPYPPKVKPAAPKKPAAKKATAEKKLCPCCGASLATHKAHKRD